MSSLKQLIKRAGLLASNFGSLAGGCTAIFTLHRFEVRGEVSGHSLQELRRALQALRRSSVDLLDLETAIRRTSEGRVSQPAICFTIDDGYFDVEHGLEVFAEFDCPVSIFVVTDFQDGHAWLWWDKIAYILLTSRRDSCRLGRLGGAPTILLTSCNRMETARQVAGWAAGLSSHERDLFISELSSVTDVAVPEAPLSQYRSLGWEGVRKWDGDLVRFGPHTASHPSLDREPATISRREIMRSWRDLNMHTARPLPILAYPNGGYSKTEVQIARDLGLYACVTTTPAYLSPYILQQRGFFRIPRLPCPENALDIRFAASGMAVAINDFRTWVRTR